MLQTLRQTVQIHKKDLPEDWDAYVQKFSHAAWYQQSGWKRVVEEVFGHESFYLALRRDGRLAGVLPLSLVRSPIFGRFLVSIPYGCFAGPLADDEDAVSALAASAEQIARETRVKYLEMRSIEPFSSGSTLKTKTFKQTFHLPLAASPETVWASFSQETRTKIRKALAAGCRISVGGREYLDDFYFVFCRRMRDLGSPVYAKKFFAKVLEIFSERALIVRIESAADDPVAAGIVIFDGRRAEIPWSAAVQEGFDAYAAYAMFWRGILESIRRGCALFDFGTSNEGSGTAEFKMRWGAEPVRLGWQYYMPDGASLPDLSPRNPKFSFLISVWKRMPLWLANRLGPELLRGIP